MKVLSIIIISYNTIGLLRDCLASVYAHSDGLDAEVFVVDNASADGSPEMVAREFPQVQLICNQDNRGFAAANNQAMEIAIGHYVLLLNSDTLVLGDVLRDSVAYLDGHPDAGAMGCEVLNPDRTVQYSCFLTPSLLNIMLLTSGLSRLNWPRWFGRYQMRDWDHRSERDVSVIAGCFLMVRRSVIEQVGLLDDAFFFFGEETDWCARFWKAGWRVVYAPVGQIVHYGSVSALKLGHQRDLLLTSGLVRYHRKHGGVFLASLVWLVLLLFNVSRLALWSFIVLLRRGEHATQRYRHFLGIVRNYGSTWPTLDDGKPK